MIARPLHWICLFVVALPALASAQPDTERQWPQAVESALVEAGDNRHELELVLTHYETGDDPLKLRAAEFLIGNMPGHGYVEHAFFDDDETEIAFDALQHANYKAATAAMDALEAEHGEIHYGRKSFVSDLESITAPFLIENIDAAFESWRTMPWAKEISFDIFCEYILPYRGSNEPLNGWRKQCRERLAAITMELGPGFTDPRQAAKRYRKAVNSWVRFSELYYLHPTDQGFDEMCETKTGRCEDITNMKGYALRAHATVSASDYTPYWAKRDNNHAWEALLDANGKGGGGYAGKAAKIYRKMFAHQPESLGAIKHDDEDVPRWLSRTHYIDVTADYMPITNVTIELTNPTPEHARFAYLCVFNGGDWRAIHWGSIQDGSATFTNMGRDIAYLPAYYVDEELVPAAAPFILSVDGETRLLDGLSEATVHIELAVNLRSEATRPTIKVQPDQAYELFVWRDGWSSLGTRTVAEESQVFDAAPAGRLYWLVRDGSRKLERIFTIEDNQRAGW